MRLPRRDILATAIVGLAGVLYGLWAVGSALPGMSSVRTTGVAVLALGFLASAGAVVPGFDRLLRGSRPYLVVTALVGLAALGGGLWMLTGPSEVGLALLVGAMGMLWLVSTIHHAMLARAAPGTPLTRGTAPTERKEAA